MTLAEAIKEVKKNGWHGICVWEGREGWFMGCLFYNGRAVTSTNLWDWVEGADKALEELVGKSQRTSPEAHK